ncbi:MAG: pilus assembly protein [Sphingobium sp.]
MTRRFVRSLLASQRGATIVEFALVLPIFLLLVLGICDLAQMLYAKALLNGAVEQAGRSSTTETADTTSADTLVEASVAPIVPGATFTFKRVSYYDFTDVGRAEKFTDANSDGSCDNGEAYIDENGNGQWDADVGASGNGGADDIVVYTATVTYTPLISVPLLANSENPVTLTAKSVRKNQPFAVQTSYSSTTGTCT